MFSWLEIIYYTLIQLAKVNAFNAILVVSFIGYLCYQGIKFLKKPMRDLFQLIKSFFDNRDIIKKEIRNKRKALTYSWKHRHEIDWKSAGRDKGKQL